MDVFTKPRIGIAITTRNRREMICKHIDVIRQLTETSFNLVICDDGSSDGTVEMLRQRGELVISGSRKGLAWNKNRGIFFLMEVLGCDVAILLHDDMRPVEQGWEARWIRAALNFGHVNFGYPKMDESTVEVDKSGLSPTLTPTLLGHCVAFHRFPWCMVGYMDPRFKIFGDEHTEFSNRFLKLGFGGELRNTDENEKNFYQVIGGALHFTPKTTKNDYTEDINRNRAIFIQLQTEIENTYRLPWINTAEKREFLFSIGLAIQHHNINVPNKENQKYWYPLLHEAQDVSVQEAND